MKTAMLLVPATLIFTTAAARAFELQSPDIAEGKVLKREQVGKSANCAGDNVSPQLDWANPPQGTRSFALTVFDPDARNGQGFWHWGVFDIPANTTSLAKGVGSGQSLKPLPFLQGKLENGKVGFTGACPPAGPAHHYIFKVMALNVEKLGLDATASPKQIDDAAQKVKLGEAKITALYAKE